MIMDFPFFSTQIHFMPCDILLDRFCSKAYLPVVLRGGMHSWSSQYCFFFKSFFFHLIVLMHIRHMNLFSFCYIFNYNRFEYLFKAFQWRSISKATVWQNGFNTNMRIYFLLNFMWFMKTYRVQSLAIFFCHFHMPRTLHEKRAKQQKNVTLKIYLCEY